MSKEFLAKKKDINELKINKADKADLSTLENSIDNLKTDVNALKTVDTSLSTRIDKVDSKASAAKTKAEEGVAKADNALAATRTNATNINTLETNVNALKAVDTSLSTRIDNVDSKASTAKTKAEEGVAKADNALAATRTNANKIDTLETNVNALKAVDERIWTNLDTVNKTASAAKVKAEEGVAKADEALARNIFTDEEKAKLASITNPIIIKGRVDTVQDLPTEAKIGWFYFVGLENASSYEEYCYSEKGWEFIGVSREGVDLSDYYTKEQIDTTVNTLKAVDTSLGTRIDNVDSKASAAKTKAEEGVAKADNALTQANSNATDINALETNVNALKAVDTSLGTRIDNVDSKASTAKTKAEEGVTKADNALAATRTNATNITNLRNDVDTLFNEKNTMGSRLTTAETNIENLQSGIKNYAAINKSTLGYQCKNMLNNVTTSKTVNGITFTVNDDKSITANGTATSRTIFLVGTAYISQTGNYTYTGTPSGGASSTYSMNYRNSNAYKTAETGNGITTQFEGGKTYEAIIDIRSGVTISNLTFYPMLRDADITDSTYEPYQPSLINRCLLKDTAGIALGVSTSSSITIDNLASYTALWINVAGAVAGINFKTNLIVPVAYLKKSTSNSVQLAGGIPSSAYTTSSGVLAAKNMDGTITAKVSGNTLDLTIGTGTIGSIEVISLM